MSAKMGKRTQQAALAVLFPSAQVTRFVRPAKEVSISFTISNVQLAGRTACNLHGSEDEKHERKTSESH